MIGTARKRNRRRDAQPQSPISAVPWKRILTAAGLLGVVAGGAGAIVWALDQPIETVAVQGSFQRVSALDVERAVKDRVRGAGLVTVKLETVQRAIETLPAVGPASAPAALTALTATTTLVVNTEDAPLAQASAGTALLA